MRDASFQIRSGEGIAAADQNEVGNTALVKLMTCRYNPAEGRVILDGGYLRVYCIIALTPPGERARCCCA